MLPYPYSTVIRKLEGTGFDEEQVHNLQNYGAVFYRKKAIVEYTIAYHRLDYILRTVTCPINSCA